MLLGAEGFLGSKLLLLRDSYEVIPFTHKTLDITHLGQLRYQVQKIKPDIIINATAISNVDLCEQNSKLSEEVNVEGVRNIANLCRNIKLIHFSTDFIFHGIKGLYKEEDAPNPVNVYGYHKYLAEQIIKSQCKDYLILRVAVLYGHNENSQKKTFVDWVRSNLEEGKTINVVDNQNVSPTLIDDILYAVKFLMNTKGIYHVAGSERISRYNMALKVAEIYNHDKNLIKPIKNKDLVLPAKRPLDSSLSIEKIKSIGLTMHNFEDGVKIMKMMGD